MYYEVYVDSLILLHFFLNLYLLALVNRLLYRIASGKRLIMGAALGTICSVIPFVLPINYKTQLSVGFVLSIWLMSKYTFRIVERKQLLQVMEKMMIMTLLLGGGLRVILKYWPKPLGRISGVFFIVLLGTVLFWCIERKLGRKKTRESVCKVFWQNGSERVEVKALLDNGNTLVEPISGKPVSVMEPETLKKILGGELPEGFRVVPFHSVGKQHGLIKAYLLERMVVEVEGICKECKNVYIGVSDEALGEGNEYQVILNPRILEDVEGER